MKIAIGGDVCPSYCNRFFESASAEEIFGDIPDAVSDCERFIVNLECALTDRGAPIDKKGPNLRATPRTAKILKKIGVTDAALANNHIFDYGRIGVSDTMEALRKAGIRFTGFGENYEDSRKNLWIEAEGKRIAVIDVCEHEYCYALESRRGARPFDPFDTLLDVRRAKTEADYVIVLYHGGKEQSPYPSPRLRKACCAMAESGADVILCQHSHCIGCYEWHAGSYILYGQGNFHFTGECTHPHWQSGLLLKLELDEKIAVEHIPIIVNGEAICLAKDEKKEEILLLLENQSKKLKNGEWITEWDAFCHSQSERYLGNIARVFTDAALPADEELFSGRMTCEAHLDVIAWLCKHYWEREREDI